MIRCVGTRIVPKPAAKLGDPRHCVQFDDKIGVERALEYMNELAYGADVQSATSVLIRLNYRGEIWVDFSGPESEMTRLYNSFNLIR